MNFRDFRLLRLLRLSRAGEGREEGSRGGSRGGKILQEISSIFTIKWNKYHGARKGVDFRFYFLGI